MDLFRREQTPADASRSEQINVSRNEQTLADAHASRSEQTLADANIYFSCGASKKWKGLSSTHYFPYSLDAPPDHL